MIVTVAGMARSAMEAFMRPADMIPAEAAQKALEAMETIDRLYGAPDFRATLTGTGSLDALASAVGGRFRVPAAAGAE